MRRFAAILIATSVSLLSAVAVSPAANLPSSNRQIASAGLVNGSIVWFQRNDRLRHLPRGGRLIRRGVGGVYARALNAKRVQRIFTPPVGSRIDSFVAANGRVVVGLVTTAKGDRGPSSVVELSAGADGWNASTLVSQTDDPTPESCGDRVTLEAIAGDGTAYVERTRLASRGEGCMLLRQESELVGLSKSGAEHSAGQRKSGWASAREWDLLPSLQPLDGLGFLQIGEYPSGTRATLSSWDPSTNNFAPIQGELPPAERIEPLGAGRVLVRNLRYEAAVYDPASADRRVTNLIGYNAGRQWFRACGDRLLEIHRRDGRRKSTRRKWRLRLRQADGEVARSLKMKLPDGTMFDACDRQTAVFHRVRHDGRISQWAIKLGA